MLLASLTALDQRKEQELLRQLAWEQWNGFCMQCSTLLIRQTYRRSDGVGFRKEPVYPQMERSRM